VPNLSHVGFWQPLCFIERNYICTPAYTGIQHGRCVLLMSSQSDRLWCLRCVHWAISYRLSSLLSQFKVVTTCRVRLEADVHSRVSCRYEDDDEEHMMWEELSSWLENASTILRQPTTLQEARLYMDGVYHA
jgi:hypothetical protein